MLLSRYVQQFEPQDVLVPWRKAEHSSSEDRNSSGLDPSDYTSTGPVTTTDDEEHFELAEGSLELKIPRSMKNYNSSNIASNRLVIW